MPDLNDLNDLNGPFDETLHFHERTSTMHDHYDLYDLNGPFDETLAQIDTIKKKIEKAKNRLKLVDTLEKELHDARAEIERLKEIDRWRSMNVGVAELNRVKKERDAIKYSEKRVLKELEVANQTIDALTEKNTELDKENGQLMRDVSIMADKIAELENQLKGAHEENADMYQGHLNLVKKNRHLKNEVENLVELSQNEEKKRDYKDFEIQALKAEIEHYKNTNKKLPDHISVDIHGIDHIARNLYAMDESKKLVRGVIGVRWEFLPPKIWAEYRSKATNLVYMMLTHITKGE